MKKGNISTRAGDKGRTGIGGGGRVDKDDKRIEALGDLDELCSFIGLLRTHLDQSHDWDPHFVHIQTELMNLMGHVATPSDAERKPALPLPEDVTQSIEDWMLSIEQ
jgi:cob(I)alamin adenosyltransferase